jgi:hypothetical protein
MAEIEVPFSGSIAAIDSRRQGARLRLARPLLNLGHHGQRPLPFRPEPWA